jgi:hypothetical protein
MSTKKHNLLLNRAFQYLGIIVIVGVIGGGYWYWREAQAGLNLQSSQEGTLSSGLVGYWPFDGNDISGTTAYDRSGQGNNGTLTNSPTKTIGKVGQGMSFDGTDDEVNISSILGIGTGPVTISCWVYLTGNTHGAFVKIGNNSPTNNDGFGLGVGLTGFDSSGNNLIGLYEGVAWKPTGVAIGVNDWHHVVMRVNSSGSSTSDYFKDGVLVSSLGSTTASTPTGGQTFIGGYTSSMSVSRHPAARIDEVRIYNRALSASEIRTLYDMGAADKVNAAESQGDALEKGIVGYWKLDDGSGTSAADASGNANTGTLTNGPTWTTGNIGGATLFDGTNDYIVTPASAALDMSGKSFTASMWFKTSTTQTDKNLMEHSIWGANDTYQLTLSGPNSLRFSWPSYWTQYSTTPDITGVTYADNQWHHVVGIFDNASKIATTYFDGVLKTTQSGITAGPLSGTNALYIGDRGAGASNFFTGSLDEIRIYNRNLSADEVAKLYRTTAPDNPDTGLVGYWPFNGPDISGTTAYDRSGKGGNGTLGNGPTKTIGKIGQGLSFDGTNDYVSASGSQSVQSISYWVRPETSNYSKYPVALSSDKRYLLNNGLYSGATVTGTRYINGVPVTGESLGSELITNGTLETGSPSSWANYFMGGATGTQGVTSSSPYAGTYSMDVNITAAGTQTDHIQIATNSSGGLFSTTLGTLYKVQFAVKGSASFTGADSNVIQDVSPWAGTAPQHRFDITTSWVLHTYYFYSKRSGASDTRIYFGIGGLGTGHVYFDNVSIKPVTSTGDVTDNVWNFVTVNLSAAVSADSVQLARSGGLFKGMLDEVRFYNRALSVGEIRTLYDMGAADKVNAAESQGDALEKGMVGYWKLDDGSGTSAADASGNANTGTLTNGPTWTTGNIGGATTFDGTDDYTSMPSSSAYNFAYNQDFGVSTWVKIPSTQVNTGSTTNEIIQKWNNSANGYPFVIRLTNQTHGTPGKINAVRYDGTNNPGVSSTTTINDNTWHFISFTKRSSVLSLYIDGALQGTATDTTTGTTSNSDPLTIGVRAGSPYLYYLTGSVDEPRIYNRALSADEVSKLYRTTAPDNPDTGLVGYWSFNGPDVAGTTAYDRSGKGNNGTLTNSPTKAIGKIGQGMRFDGTDDYISVPTASGNFAAPVTMSFFVSSTLDSARMLYAVTDSTANNLWQIGIGDGFTSTLTDELITFGKISGGTTQYTIGYTTTNRNELFDGKWHLITAVSTGSTWKLYLDGAEKTLSVGYGSDNGSYGTVSGANTCYVGARKIGASPDLYFNGKIDEPRIYNRALSQSEITALYNAGR